MHIILIIQKCILMNLWEKSAICFVHPNMDNVLVYVRFLAQRRESFAHISLTL